MVLTTGTMPAILSNVPTRDRQLGGIAQLGERLTGSQEVSGSIPLISTRERHDESRVFLLVRNSWTERSAPVSGRTTKNKNWVLTITAMPVILSTVPTRDKQFGGIAQLGERLTGSQEVSGSIPLISTRERHDEGRVFLFILDTGFPAGKGEISGKSRLPPMQARKNTLKYKR